MDRILECVPNFSEGRDLAKVEKIVDCFRAKPGVKLLDYSSDADHNRSVVTVIGEPEPLRDAMVEAIGKAVELIDMTKHEGQHPRMGCVDVVPFIPVRGTTIEDAEKELLMAVLDTCTKKKGKLIIPSFAVGRAQVLDGRLDLCDVCGLPVQELVLLGLHLAHEFTILPEVLQILELMISLQHLIQRVHLLDLRALPSGV